MALLPDPLTKPEEVLPATPDYEPIPAQPESLLATAVGTPMAPLPPIDPATYEDDDVVNQMNKITSQDSDYMKLARTSGLQTANKRGLLNSSIAAGASQAEALRAAAPLAGQNASQAASRNLARIQGYFDQQKQEAQFGHEVGMQERQLTAAEEQQMKDIEARMTMQGIDIESQRELQQKQLDASRELAEANIAAEMERLGRQLTAQEEAQIRDLASRQDLLTQELGSRETLAREEFASQMERLKLSEEMANVRANLDAATRTQLAEMENLTEQQKASLAFYVESNKMYADSIDALYANKDMPAPARDAAMQNFLALRNAQANLPALLFGTNLNWPAGTAPAGAIPGGVPEPINPASQDMYTGPSREEILSYVGDHIDGNYDAAKAAWDAAHPGDPLPTYEQVKSGQGGGGYFDTIGKYSGAGILKGLLG